MKNKIDTKKLTISAIMIALATVLSLVKVWEMPLGGSITLLSMLPICLVSITYGIKWGFACSFVYSLGQLALSIAEVVSWGLTPLSLAGAIALDYIVPFTLLGLSGIFRKQGIWGAISGISLSLILRFICHFISGIIIFDIWCEWENVPLYSFCYNGTFMLPELILTVLGTFFVLKSSAIKNIIENNK